MVYDKPFEIFSNGGLGSLILGGGDYGVGQVLRGSDVKFWCTSLEQFIIRQFIPYVFFLVEDSDGNMFSSVFRSVGLPTKQSLKFNTLLSRVYTLAPTW